MIAKRLEPFFTNDLIKERLAFLTAKEAELALPRAKEGERTPVLVPAQAETTSTIRSIDP